MNGHEDLDQVARTIIDDNRWVSSPDAQHSENLAARPELSIVVFDSHASVGEGQGVYMSAVAELLTGTDLERGIEIFSRVSVSHGARPWTVEDVQPPAALRLYRAHVSEHWVLDPERRPDQRTRVRP